MPKPLNVVLKPAPVVEDPPPDTYLWQMLREDGLLEGSELSEAFMELCRDVDFGTALFKHGGLRLGLANGRLYLVRHAADA